LVEKRSTRYLVVADETMLTETKLPTFVWTFSSWNKLPCSTTL
jgi:hypothetical protein